jgi:hypothetical protein
MAREFLTNINLNKNELQNAAIQSLTTAPSSPVVGQIYFDTSSNNLRQWDGTQWLDYITAEAGGSYITSTTTDFTVTTGELSLNYENVESTLTGDGFALTTDISTALEGYATETYVTGQGYITSAALSGYATESFVTTQGYITSSALSGYATETYVSDRIGDNTVDGTTGNTITDRISSAISGIPANYITSVGSNLSVTTGELDLGENVVITDATQTLSNKTIDGAKVTGTTSFRDGSDTEYMSIYKTNVGTAEIEAVDDLALRAAHDVILYPGNGNTGSNSTGKAYIGWGNAGSGAHPEREIATIGTDQTFTNKTIGDGGIAFNDGTYQYGNIYNDGSNNLIIDGSNNDVIITSDSGYAYIGTNSDSSTRIATWAHVSAVASGLNVKDSVLVASTADVPDLNDVLTVDGVFLENGYRVLLKNQANIIQNGIYVYDHATTTLSRADDQLTPEKGDYVFVEEGTNAARGFIVTNITNLPAGGVVWTQFSAAGEYTAGDGIDISGTTISVDLDGDSLSVSGSGLKANLSATGGLDTDGGIYINTGSGLTVNGSNELTIDTAVVARKYSESNGALTATSGSVTWAVTHNLGTHDVIVQVFDVSTYAQVEVDVVHTSINVVTLSWASAGESAGAYRVVVIG